jgi:hypothetical protein
MCGNPNVWETEDVWETENVREAQNVLEIKSWSTRKRVGTTNVCENESRWALKNNSKIAID